MIRSRVTFAMIEAAATVAQRASPSTRFVCGQARPLSATKSVMTRSGSTLSWCSASSMARRVACRMLMRSMVR